ncbi:MAG TPA: hypothetical protein VGC04_06300 [Cellulomonas sp.]
MNPWLGALVVLLALGVSTGGGWAVTRLVLRIASRSSDAGGMTSTRTAAGATETTAAAPEPDATTPDARHDAAGDDTRGPFGDGPDGPVALAALRGGTWIGLLERLATTGALLLGEPTAIAVVVAVKGLGRYPELREHPAASERFVVGSLASLTWAAAIGFLGRWLLTR